MNAALLCSFQQLKLLNENRIRGQFTHFSMREGRGVQDLEIVSVQA
jgi:hypothetical protein